MGFEDTRGDFLGWGGGGRGAGCGAGHSSRQLDRVFVWLGVKMTSSIGGEGDDMGAAR